MGVLAAQPSRPHIVVLIADDLGWNDVGFHGSEIRTPHLDRLAAQGAILDQFYVQPVCSPTRAAFLTGRYPMRYGLSLGVFRPGSDRGLPVGEKTLAEALTTAGYRTVIAGKWHLGHSVRAYLPTARGFQRQYGYYLGAVDYFTHQREGGLDWHRDERALREEGHTTDLIAAEAIRQIENHQAGAPLFLYVAFGAPHMPLQAPEEQVARYAHIADPQRRKYAAMVSHLDEAIGRIQEAIQRSNISGQTLLLFCSDNGGASPAADNRPLRDEKGSVYEGGVRVPALAVWPGRIDPGTKVRQPLHIVDWHAMLLKLAGINPEAAEPPLDGRDCWPALTGDPRPIRDEILINAVPLSVGAGRRAEAGTGALRQGDWKLVINGAVRFKEASPGPEFRLDEWVRRNRAAPEISLRQIELFNLADDPGERHNLASEHPGRVRDLLSRYESYAQQAVPLLWGGLPADFTPPAVWGAADKR